MRMDISCNASGEPGKRKRISTNHSNMLWVLKNVQYGIRIATPVLIETYFSANLPPHGQDPSLIAAQVTKQPQGNGKYQFNAIVWRYTPLNGDQNQWDAMLDFNKQINSFTP
jgi:hypothetical protein